MRRNATFLVAILLDLVGAGVALLVSARHWQTIRTPQPSRLDVLEVTGRSVDSASTALALVALAGVVAVLATRGWARRVVGIVLLLAGAGLVWRAFSASSAVGLGRARSLVESAHPTVSAAGVTPQVTTHAVWAVLSAVCGALVLVSGILVAWRGHRWSVLSARYEAPGDESPEAASEDVADEVVPDEDEATRRRTRAATAMWTAMDRGEDPTR